MPPTTECSSVLTPPEAIGIGYAAISSVASTWRAVRRGVIARWRGRGILSPSSRIVDANQILEGSSPQLLERGRPTSRLYGSSVSGGLQLGE